MAPVDICILAHIGSSECLRFKFLQSKDPPIEILKIYSLSLLEMVKSRTCKEKGGLVLNFHLQKCFLFSPVYTIFTNQSVNGSLYLKLQLSLS